MKWITINKFEDLTGYTQDAVRSKIKRGDWLENYIWKKAPDGRILINTEAYQEWVENPAFVQHRKAV